MALLRWKTAFIASFAIVLASASAMGNPKRWVIDPDPKSPTLGDLYDKPVRRAPAAAKPAPSEVLRPASKPVPVRPVSVRPEPAAPMALRYSIPEPAQAFPASLPREPARAAAPKLMQERPAANIAAPSPPRRVEMSARPVAPVLHTGSVEKPAEKAENPASQIKPPAAPAPSATPVSVPPLPQAAPSAPAALAPAAVAPPSLAIPAINAPKLERIPALPNAPASEPPKAAPAAANAADPTRQVYVVDQDLRSFLTDFARRVGMRSDIAPSVRGRLTKVRLPAEPTALLRDLEKRHEIEWVIEGELLKVSARAELATRILPLGKVSFDDLLSEVKAAGIEITRYPLQKMAGSQAATITAPVNQIARISALLDALKAGKSTGPEIRVIRAGIGQRVTWD